MKKVTKFAYIFAIAAMMIACGNAKTESTEEVTAEEQVEETVVEEVEVEEAEVEETEEAAE